MITPDEILRDKLVIGIRDNKVRVRLLHKSKLTLAETDGKVCNFIRNRKQLIRSSEPSPPDADVLQQPWKNPSDKAPRMPTPPSKGACPKSLWKN